MEKSIEETCRQVYKMAENNERSNTGCAQSAMAAILDVINRPNDDLFRAVSGLADGLGLSTKGTCGALVAGALAIGLVFGRKREDFSDPLAAMDSYDLVLDLVDQFEKKIGALRCQDIQTAHAGRSFNLRNPDDMEAALDAGLLDHCAGVVATAAEMATRIIVEES